jgi:hypothetical protein
LGLLLQLPYGVLGVTVLTAIMPRLSRNAAEGDRRDEVGRRDRHQAATPPSSARLPEKSLLPPSGLAHDLTPLV